MDIARLRRVSDVLDATLTREPSEWPALLDEACSGDPELRREVEEHLARLDSARSFLDSPPLAALGALLTESRETDSAHAGYPREGQRIGAYRVLRELGRGGMSRVFLAVRADGQFEQHVAVKLLRPGLDSELDQQRLRAERQILASLSHAHIARLFDGGVTDDGIPYLVMEYVEGEPLDRYCAARALPLRERLTLFLDVADATQYAHRNLVVHRDLKPSNILVATNGTVKLLDFGLAKLMQGDATLAAPTTRTGHRWMTPEYAAPEQIRGDTASTLTDVYQLGAVLYELLTGRLPFAGRTGGFFELERAILEEQPELPSVAALRRRPTPAAGPDDSASAPSEADGVRHRSKALRGDLDAIVMKALHKEPERRYASAAAMRDDIERFLEGRAVVARPDSTAHRLRRFTRRNRAAVSAAGVTVAALVFATAFSASQAREARRQRDVAEAQVRRQNAMAELQAVLAGDARGPGGRVLTLIERIESAEQALLGRFGKEPALIADVLIELAERLYENSARMGDYRRVLARAAGLAKSASLPLQYALAECHRAYSFVYDDQFDSARVSIAVARAAVANDERSADAVVESSCLAAEGNLLVATGEADSAIVLLRRAVELSATVVRAGHLGRLNDLALALRAAGRTREATDQQRLIVSELDSTGYRRTDGFPNALGYLASGLWELGELTEVDSILREYVRADEATYGPGNTEPFIGFMYGLGKLRLGALDSADHWFAITLKDTTATPAVRLVYAPPALTQLRLEQGELAKARDAFATLPTGTHTRRVTAALLGARLRNAEGDPLGALRMLDSSLRALAGDGPTPPANMAQALTTAAEWHLAAGDARGADSLAQLAHLAAARDSLTMRRGAYAGAAALARARALVALGNRAAAREAARRAAEALAVGYGASSTKAREGKALLDSLRN